MSRMTNETKPPAPDRAKQNRLAAALIPLIGFGFAGILLLPRMCAHQREQQLLEQGSPAVAEILSIRETGNVYNRKPEVKLEIRLQPPTGDVFTLEVKKVFSQTELARYVPGAFVEVRYDPTDPDDAAFVRLLDASERPAKPGAEGSAK
jgi:hypothetical protein